ncbi:class II aldolase/adducin family protein [Herbiconiux sp.]|uniref:class II aldolase/adducin family protein n=1 Tax=Herbiconiux sp. TaxID=1871186 RepID=UPI0025B87B14|nr:class II aldolase/adducin family protein [Herbiconiux sp.]
MSGDTPGSGSSATDIRTIVSLSSRILGGADQGDFIWGHGSARDPEGRGVWIKESGIGLAEVGPDRVHLVSPEGEVLEGSAGPRHIEYPIHTEIMAARPDVGGVVHTHSPHAIALAAAGVELLPVSHAATHFVPPQVPRFTQTANLIRTRELGAALAETLGSGSNAVFLVNHGIVTVGPDLQTATVSALLLEAAAQQQLLTMGFGGPTSWSDDEEALAKREIIYSPAALHTVWDHLVRRLT